MRRNKFIALAFAVATFATLALTVGRNHCHDHGHWQRHGCTEQTAPSDN